VEQTGQIHKVHNRLAVCIVAVERVAEAMKLRGWYSCISSAIIVTAQYTGKELQHWQIKAVN